MPTRDFLLAPDGTVAIINGDLALVGDEQAPAAVHTYIRDVLHATGTNQAAVGQGCKIRVSLYLGEYWLNQALGVPYLQQILGKGTNPLVARSLIAEAIGETPDVTTINGTPMIDNGDRSARITFTVQSIYGRVTGTAEVGS